MSHAYILSLLLWTALMGLWYNPSAMAAFTFQPTAHSHKHLPLRGEYHFAVHNNDRNKLDDSYFPLLNLGGGSGLYNLKQSRRRSLFLFPTNEHERIMEVPSVTRLNLYTDDNAHEHGHEERELEYGLYSEHLVGDYSQYQSKLPSSQSKSRSKETSRPRVVRVRGSSSTKKNITKISPRQQHLAGQALLRKPKQKRRRPSKPRRPAAFWKNITNIEIELRNFWHSVHVYNFTTDISSIRAQNSTTVTANSTCTNDNDPITSSYSSKMDDRPPSIPSEALLNHFERHDLRYAIANMGGRKSVASKLGGAYLIPGKWHVAISESVEVRCLLHPSNPKGRGLSCKVPPMAPHVKRNIVRSEVRRIKCERKKVHDVILDSFLESGLSRVEDGNGDVNRNGNFQEEDGDLVYRDISRELWKDSAAQDVSEGEENGDSGGDSGMEGTECDLDFEVDLTGIELASINDNAMWDLRYPRGERWAHQETRKPRGYWDEDVVLEELYEYLIDLKHTQKRPAVWMARPGDIANGGRNDLRLAMTRFGGADYFCRRAGLVPYREWRYFESQLELFVELDAYLTKHHDGDWKEKKKNDNDSDNIMFPRLAEIRNNGHDRLYDLIMEFGGRKIVATRLDMKHQTSTKDALMRGMSFGKFDLGFAIQLMYFIRNAMLESDPRTTREDKVEGEEHAIENNDRSRGAGQRHHDCERHIQMPIMTKLLKKGEKELAKQVLKYGGHESVARRLNLSYDEDEARRDTISQARKNMM